MGIEFNVTATFTPCAEVASLLSTESPRYRQALGTLAAIRNLRWQSRALLLLN